MYEYRGVLWRNQDLLRPINYTFSIEDQCQIPESTRGSAALANLDECGPAVPSETPLL